MNRQEETWAGEFGNEYTKRCRVDWRKRIPFWREILDLTGVRSVFELGCNAGWNLSAIEAAAQRPSDRAGEVGWPVSAFGYDLNESAISQARAAGLTVFAAGDVKPDDFDPVDLAFTAGVLIHIAPDNLQETMQSIIDRSCDYVMSIEYEDDTEVEVEYRGQKGLLWRRPYGKLYEQMGLKPVLTGVAGGFDNCQFWLLRK